MTATARPRPANQPDRRRPARSVDPRVQARRAQVARQEDLRRLWAVGSMALVTSLAVVAIGVVNSSLFDVERVTVQGAVRADPDEVVAATGVVAGQSLLEVDPDQARQAVEAVPWVHSAVVDRQWRGGVVVTIEERSPLVAVTTAGGQILVDGTGRQLEVVLSPPDDLLPVTGLAVEADPGAQVPPAIRRAVNLTLALTPALADSAVSVSVAEGELDLHLDGGRVVVFGDDRMLADKLVAVETVLARVDLSCLAVIRVEVPSSPTVGRTVAAPPEPVGGQEPGDDGGGC